MKSLILTSLLSLGLLSTVTAQELTADNINPVSLDVDFSSLEPAVQKYVMEICGQGMIAIGKAMGEGKGLTPQLIVEIALPISKSVPQTDLPEEYKNYLKDVQPITEKIAAEMVSIQEGDNEAYMILQSKYQPEMDVLKAKYPTASAVLNNQEAIQNFLIQDLNLQEKAMQYVMENKADLEADQSKMFSALFQFMGEEILKEARK